MMEIRLIPMATYILMVNSVCMERIRFPNFHIQVFSILLYPQMTPRNGLTRMILTGMSLQQELGQLVSDMMMMAIAELTLGPAHKKIPMTMASSVT